MSLGHFGPAQLQSRDPGTGLGTRREAKNSPKVEASFPEGRGAGLTGASAAPAQSASSPSDFFSSPCASASSKPGPFPILRPFGRR